MTSFPYKWLVLFVLPVVGVFYLPISAQNASGVEHVYLTLSSPDSGRTINVHYQTHSQSLQSTIHFDTTSRGGDPDLYRWTQMGQGESLSSYPYSIHTLALSGLTSDTTYYFVVGDPDRGYSREYKFRTLPEDGSEIRLIQGGDMNISEHYSDIARPLLPLRPQLYLVGGDIAYANGWLSNGWRWKRWFERLKTIAEDPDGFLIPLVVAVGNHEVNGAGGSPLDRAPYYFRFFPQAGDKPYFVRELGNHTALFVLDSGHIVDHGGEQTAWLEGELEKYEKWPSKIALYHVPLYPSHRSFNTFLSKEGRKYWLPLFDQFRLTLGMENHDHTVKRTFPLRNGTKVERDGTVFIGDGCWGQGVRSARQEWYLETSKSERHAWFLSLSETRIQGTAYGENTQILDQFTIAR